MKTYYTKNLSGINNCPNCNAENAFPIKIEEQEDGLFKVYTTCKKCRHEIFLKLVGASEALKLARNKSIKA